MSRATRAGSGNKGEQRGEGDGGQEGQMGRGRKEREVGREGKGEREPAERQAVKEMKSPHQTALQGSRKLLAEGATGGCDLKDSCREMVGS